MRLSYHFADGNLYLGCMEVLAWAWSGAYNLNAPLYYVAGFLTPRDTTVEIM